MAAATLSFFEVEKLDAAGAAAGTAAGFGVDADDLVELTDDQKFDVRCPRNQASGLAARSRWISSMVIVESHLWRSAV